MWREYEVQFVFIMSCLSLHYISNCAFALVKDKTSIVVNSASIDSDKSAVEQRQQLGSDLVAVIGQRSGLSIIINGRETGIPSLADQACHAVAYARNGPLFVATDRKIFRLDASVGLPIEAADSDARASGSGRRVGGGGSGDGGRAQAIIADHIIQALAVDDIGRKVYWVTSTDLRAGQVSTLNVDNYNGTDRRTLFRMPATHTILSHTLAVDSLHACLIFFVDVQTHSAALGVKQLHIHRLDGQEVYNVSHISEANSIVAVTVDAEKAIIYWMESNSGDTPVQVRGFSYSTLLPTFAASASPSAQAPPSPFAVLDIAKIDRPSNTLAYQGGRLYWMRGLEIVACELSAGSGSATTAACRTALTRSNSRAGEILFHLVLLSKSDYRAWPAAFTDVCSVRKPCAHLCFRYSSTIADQRYTCLCRFGLLPDPKNATHGCLSMLKMSLDTQDYHPVQLFGMPKYIVKCLAMDPLANVIYWIDYLHERVARSVTETIRRLDLTRNQPGRIEKILENADEVPQDLAVDWSSGNLYWVTARKLIISKLDGRHQYVLSTFDKITAVKVDPIRGYLFYCADGRLVRSRLDGVGGAVSANISLSRAVAAVRSPAKVYAAFRGHLYWLSTSGDMSLGIVDRNGSNTRVVPISLRIPLSLAASSSQLATEFAAEIDSNPCRRPDNAGCEQLCIPRPDLTDLPVANRRICRCASRFRFAGTVSSSTGGESAPAPEDGHSRCQALSTFLVLASARDIGMAPLNLAAGSASSPDYESLHLSNDLKFVEFVAADPSRGRICWADVGRHIACAGLDRGTGADTAAGRSARVVVPAVTQPLGLAVDWATNLLFYIDKWPWPRLCAVSLDRPSLTRTLLVSDRLSGARGLVHLALDQASRRLYFSDDKSVKSVTYEGQELRTLPLSVKPVGVAYHNSTVHFVALNSRRIHRVRVSPVTGEFVANRDEFGSGSVELPSGFRPI
uniref:Low-density lipoprotein receptor-related protein 6 n=1 Tax=Macrostomum lignano TaxID=282301 RepID=A0A1I8GX89_9PLAT